MSLLLRTWIGSLAGGGVDWDLYDCSNVSATVTSHTTITVTWTDGTEEPDGYRVYVNDAENQTVNHGVGTANITGLSAETEYTIKVVAYIGSSEGTPDSDTVTTIPIPLLDSYTAAAAYSLRKIRTAYAGSAIQVRRSSDNATQDIGFSGGFLDESALTTFIGSNSGYISIWYDQSGNGVNLANTADYQPLIVLNGTILKYNNRPYASFDGINDGLWKANITQFKNISYIGAFIVQRFRSVPAINKVIFLISRSPESSGRFFLSGGVTPSKYFVGGRRLDAEGLDSFNSITDITNAQMQITAIADYANSDGYLYLNGSNDVTDTGFTTAGSTSNTDSGNFSIGSNFYNSGSGNYSDSDIWEMVFFNTTQAANRTVIEGNQSAFFLTNSEILNDNIEFESTIE